MKILAIDSSGLVATVAIVEAAGDTPAGDCGDTAVGGVSPHQEIRVIAEYTVNNKMTHSQTLLPMIDEMFRLSGTEKCDIEAIAIAAGPGSFTGLRIGTATAKGLGLALNIPLIRVPTVDAYAYNLYGTAGLVCPLMDARRNQVYTGLYRCGAEGFSVVKKQCVTGIDAVVSGLNELGEHVIFLGDGLPVNREYIEANITTAYSFAPAHLSRQRAAAVGVMALRYADDASYPEVTRTSAADFVPEYLRLSQAEREMLEHENSKRKEKP